MKNKYEIRGETTAIFLSRRDGSILETLIDTADLPRVKENPGRWHAHQNANTFYVDSNVRAENERWVTVKLHRWLMNPPEDYVIDHIDGNGLNNRRDNLRICTQAQNAQNYQFIRKDNRSGIRGVSWHKRRRKWQAYVKLHGKQMNLGYFTDLKEAETVAKQARAKYLLFSIEAKGAV